MDPEILSGLGKIRIMRIGIICKERNWDLPICLDENSDKTCPKDLYLNPAFSKCKEASLP